MGVETPKDQVPKLELPKTPLQKPEIPGETIFIGEAKPKPEQPIREKKMEKMVEAPKIPTEKMVAKIHTKAIIEKAMEEDPFVRQVFGEEPIKDPKVEEFVANRLEFGKKLSAIGHDLEDALKNGELEVSANTMATLARIEQTTGEKYEVLHIEAGAPPEPPQIYNEADPTKETIITDPDLVNEMKRINYSLRNDPRFKDDAHRLNNAKQEILKLGREKGIPDEQIQEAVGRVNVFWSHAEEPSGRGRFSETPLTIEEKNERKGLITTEMEHYLDQIEASPERVSDFAEPVRHVNGLISEAFRSLNYQDALELSEYRDTVFALHNIYVALTHPPFDQDKIRTFREGAGQLRTEGLLNLMARETGGIDRSVGTVTNLIDQIIPEIVQGKENGRFELSDLQFELPKRINSYLNSLEGKEKGQNEAERARIIRRGVRTSLALLRAPYLVAREGKMPESIDRLETDAWGPVVRLFALVRFHRDKWGTISPTEKRIIDEVFGGFDNLEKIMSDYNDNFSSAWKIRLHLEALDEAGYNDAGLWMRFRYVDATGTWPEDPKMSDDEKKALKLERKTEVLRKILDQDTHIFPILEVFREDRELLGILEKSGFSNLQEFERQVSMALFAKLQWQLNNHNKQFDSSFLTEQYKKILEDDAGVIDQVKEFLNNRLLGSDDKRNDFILNQTISISENKEGTKTQRRKLPSYLWDKTLSITDVPVFILKDSKSLTSQMDIYARALAGDTFLAHQIFENVNKLIRNPQALTGIDELVMALESLGGRAASSKMSKELIKGLSQLNAPKWWAEWIPEPIIDFIPGMYASRLQEIRGKQIKPWTVEQRVEVFERMILSGNVRPEDIHELEKIMKSGKLHRVIPTIKFLFILGLITAAISAAEAAKKEDQGH